MPTVRSTSSQDQGPPGIQPGAGSTLFLEFNKPLPDLTPDELKQLLSPFLNFSKERSAAVQWFDTLPPEMKKAIQDRTPVVGMDREELVAASAIPRATILKTGSTASPPRRPSSSASGATASLRLNNFRSNPHAKIRPKVLFSN